MRALLGAALLLAACGTGTLESDEIARLAGTPAPRGLARGAPRDAEPREALVTPPAPIRLHGRNLATLPKKRAGVPRVLVLGDSIAAGFGLTRHDEPWPTLLAERLAEEGVAIEILNGGVFGFTTFGGLLLADLGSLKPDVVVVELGGNDYLHGVPLPALRTNLEKIVAAARGMQAAVLLVGVHLPGFLKRTDRGREFEELYTDLSDELDVPLVPDMFEDILGNPRFMQPDSIHPNAEGQKIVADNVLDGLRPLVLALVGG